MAARASRLSLEQTRQAAFALQNLHNDAEFEIMKVRTAGDRDPRPLFAMDQKGIFAREIDSAVLEKKADFAVHSLKDIPSRLPDGLTLACVPKRGPADDILITRDGCTIPELSEGAVIGTSSLRRAVQLRRMRSDLRVRPIRGNIETRISKVGKECDGIVLAMAGVFRLGLDVKFAPLPKEDFVPSPGQGALALVARRDDRSTVSFLQEIQDLESMRAAEAERAVSGIVNSGCRFPLGVHASFVGEMITLNAAAFSVDGSASASARVKGRHTPLDAARTAAEDLARQGIREMARGWREGLAEWNAR